MENEILENGTTPETEEVVETVEAVEIAAAEAAPEAAPEAEKTSVVDTVKGVANNAVAKGKALWADRANLLAKAKELPGKLKTVPKKIWMMIGGGVAALIALIVVVSLLGNNYKTPIKAVEKALNSKSVSQVLNRAPQILNGFGESEAKTLIKIAKKTDMYKDNIEDIEDGFDTIIEGLEDTIGKNYKISLKVTDKEKLDKDAVKAFRNQLRSIAEMGEQLDDLDKDDYADMADDLGISKGQVKKGVKALKSFCKDCKGAKVKKGYELKVEAKVTGKELDEPMEMELSVNVFKVDGRWVIDVFSLADSATGMMGGLDIDDLMSIAGAF